MILRLLPYIDIGLPICSYLVPISILKFPAPPTEAEHDRVKEVLGWVTDMIKPTGYVAGTNHMTLADIAFVATISTALATGDVVVNMPKIANHTKNAYRSL